MVTAKRRRSTSRYMYGISHIQRLIIRCLYEQPVPLTYTEIAEIICQYTDIIEQAVVTPKSVYENVQELRKHGIIHAAEGKQRVAVLNFPALVAYVEQHGSPELLALLQKYVNVEKQYHIEKQSISQRLLELYNRRELEFAKRCNKDQAHDKSRISHEVRLRQMSAGKSDHETM